MRSNKLFLSVLSGLMLGFSWPFAGSITPFIFIALVPLLLIEDELIKENKKGLWPMIKYGFPAFFIFNLQTTWFIYEVQESFITKFMSAGPAIVLNATFMTIAFALFHATRAWIGRKEGYFALIAYWIAWEFLHLNWELSWPWLTLGNVFSIRPNWVQWYEYTGILGGSIWILVINLFIFKSFRNYIQDQLNWKIFFIKLFFLFVPFFAMGYFLKNRLLKELKKVDIVLVQPNIDPYNEKFTYDKSLPQLEKMLVLAAEKITPETDLVLFPETALQEPTYIFPKGAEFGFQGLWENNIETSKSVILIRQFLRDYPNLTLIFGLSSDRLQAEDEPKVPASRYLAKAKVYYQTYNAALVIGKNRRVGFYHKSKLVPAVESMPMQWLLEPLADVIYNMGGTSGSLGIQEDQVPFYFGDSIGISPAICYESIYGEVFSEFISNGADIIGIITNDGWWGDSPGYKQHFSYARLRAIESRKWVARAANTGISGFINPRGEVVEKSTWWVPAVLSRTISTNDSHTFYIKYGDYLGRLAAFMAILMLIYTVVRYINRKDPEVRSYD